MENEQTQIIKKKAEFYYSMNLKCHVKIKGTGFRNGWIVSEFIEQGSYFNFRDLRFPDRPDRIFLDEVYDIKEYEETVKEGRE